MESQTVQEKEPRLLPIVKLHGITKRITGLIHFFSSGYLIRLHIENFQKYLYFHKKLTFIRTRHRQNQHLWCHYGDMMSLGNCGVFQLLKEGDLRVPMTLNRGLVGLAKHA